MSGWIHAILVGGGIGLFFASRQLEQWLKEREEQEKNANLKAFDKHFANPATQARFEKLRADDQASIWQAKSEIEQRKSVDLQEIRERYRHGLKGIWSTTEVIPMGCSYEFREDGTGLMIEYRGFGGWEVPFQWRSVGDWTVEIKFDFSPGYWERFAVEPEGDIESNDDADDDWEWVKYDFIVADLGYLRDRVVLCSAHDAKRYKESHSVIHDEWFGFRDCDGPLV